MMKHKLSITLDEEVILKIFPAVARGKYKNRSHYIEHAVKKFLEVENGQP